jgi:hypothetical protein
MIRGIRFELGFVTSAALVLLVANVQLVEAQSQAGRRMVAVSFSAGLARPFEQAFREIYGGLQYPVTVQADIGLQKHLLVFGGYSYLSRGGRTAIPANSGLAAPGDALKLKVHSCRFGALYAVSLRKVTLTGGGGTIISSYRENWDAAGIATKGSKAGFTAQGGAEYALSRRFGFIGRIEYSNIPIKAKSAAENDTNLGRLEFSIGLVLRLTATGP